MRLKLFVITAICVLFGAPLSMQAAGIQVSPSKLIFSLAPNVQETSLEITIANPTTDVQIYEIYADNYAENFYIEPESFTLESGTTKIAKLTLRRKGFEPTASLSLAGNISIIGQPLADSRINMSTGIKLPFTVEISPANLLNPSPNFPDWAMLLTGAGGMTLIIFIAWRFKIFSIFPQWQKRIMDKSKESD